MVDSSWTGFQNDFVVNVAGLGVSMSVPFSVTVKTNAIENQTHTSIRLLTGDKNGLTSWRLFNRL